MNDEDWRREVEARLEDAENIAEVTNKMIEKIGELSGKLDFVAEQFTQHMLNLGKVVQENGTNNWKTALQFGAVIVIPVLVALIGGYFALKAGLQAHPSK